MDMNQRQGLNSTENRRNDNDEIKDIPRNGKIFEIQCDQLHRTFDRKSEEGSFWTSSTVKLDLHGNKEVIDVSKNTIVGITLVVMFETHAEHIEEDADHDEYIELLIRG